ncbi:S-adenosyl-L-methionine-dependent methyltransferase [Endogone sp. FLAS-F59071]|nr:S-adenosyl-L-methionine-dependent methyltransferase [Endogone sp. FLAS-F59071]|eukprot:RUS19948.1 S-adenosyl-L-methionine-dependent methyltransferase [Endogone sp. FLAS-F59071]
MAGTENQTNNLQEVPEGFRIIGDRRFMAEANLRYILPNDEVEMNRLDYQHYVLKHLRHGNFTAPMNELLEVGITVLDAGCGSGRWALEMAEEYPNSTFYATDCAEVFPTANVPSNVIFLKANTVERLPFPDNTFDYVFQRFMFLAFSPSDWEKALAELVRVTIPGGCVELMETSLYFHLAPPAYTPIYESCT